MKLNKKHLTIVALAVLIAFVAAVGMVVASEATKSITGTIEQTDTGLVINAEDGQYQLTGQDLSELVGKKLKVTGTVSEAEGGKTINVMSFEELE